MKWSRLLFVALAAAATAAALYGWLFLRPAPDELPPSTVVTQQPSPPPPAAPLAPLPRLTVRALDAGVEVRRRGATAETGCATAGTTEPLCPGEYDVRATTEKQAALAVVWLERGATKELDLALKPASSVELTVVDSDKLPVDRARVTAQHVVTGYVLEGKTDSDGTVSLGPVVAGDYLVMASRDGWAVGAAIVSAGRSATVRLPLLKALDGALSPPVSGLAVALRTPEHAVVAVAISDGGSFSFAGVPEGRYELAVESDDFVPRVEAVAVPSAGVTLALSAGATIKGDVRSVAPVIAARPKKPGVPEPEPPPTALPPDGTPHVVQVEGPGRSRTLATRDGAFELRGLEPGRWLLTSGRSRAIADVSDGGIARIELNVPRFTGTLDGTCAVTGGHRLPATVTVRALAETGEVWSSADCSSGTFELTGLQPGFYTLEAEAREGSEVWTGTSGAYPTGGHGVRVGVPGVAWLHWRMETADGRVLSTHQREHFESRDVEVPDEAAPFFVPRVVALERGRDTDAGVFRFVEPAKLSGRVLDAATKDPIERATASVGSARFVTGEQGRFSGELPEGTYRVRIEHPAYVAAERVADAPGETEVELVRAARAVGTVVTADGRAADGLEVWAISERATLKVPVTGNTFATPHLTDGRWLLRVAGPGVLSAFDTVELDVKGSGDSAVQLVERAAGLTFEVAVTDAALDPVETDLLLVPRVAAGLANDLELERLLRFPGLVADSAGTPGRYRFEHVPPGGYTLLARARRHAWTLAVPVAVEPGMRPLGVTFPHVAYSQIVKRDSR